MVQALHAPNFYFLGTPAALSTQSPTVLCTPVLVAHVRMPRRHGLQYLNTIDQYKQCFRPCSVLTLRAQLCA